jgi:hypothetical protein
MIRLSLVAVGVAAPDNQPLLLLREEAPGRRHLPISIGQPEAMAILSALQGLDAPRPMTHDLLKNVLEELAARVDRVVITEVREGTFHAELEVLRDDSRHRISSRPSDAVALAVRYEELVPIFAEEGVLEKAGVVLESDDEEEQVEQFRKFLEQADPEDFAS